MQKKFVLKASAKLNLGLSVLGRRADGYHNLETVMQQISLADTLTFEPCTTGRGWTFFCSDPDLAGDENLVCRAASLLSSLSASVLPGVRISLYKNTPVQAGLGGGSSDAAAALLGLNRFWQLGLKKDVLLILAARLGSDVSFCLQGGTAVARGRGELIEQLHPLPFYWVVLALPPQVHISTGAAYKMLDPLDFGKLSLQELIKAIEIGDRKAIDDWLAGSYTNTFQEAIIKGSATLGRLNRSLQLLSLNPALSGSGPALFILTADYNMARSAAYAVRENGGKAFLSWTMTGNREWLYV